MSAFDDLMAFQRQTEALAQVAGRLGWDLSLIHISEPTRPY